MRVLLPSLLLLAAALAGCVNQAAPPEALAPSSLPPAPLGEPVVATWDGRITASQLGPLAHTRDTEPLVADVEREGFLLDVTEPPRLLQAALTWTGNADAQMLVMVSSPRVDGKGLEYFTKMTKDQPLCLQVPPAEITAGKWQIMAHSRDAMQVDFQFAVITLGGAASILKGEPHSSAEAAETKEAPALPCDPAYLPAA
jgi:hypothetical protein